MPSAFSICSSSESGVRLAALRKEAGLTQAALAQAVGIPQRTVSFYEREASAIASTLIPKFAKALGVSMEELLGIDNSSVGSAAPSPNSNDNSKPLCPATNSRRFSPSSKR